MSIGLAITKLAEYTSAISRLTEEVGNEESKLLAATASKDDNAIKDVQRRLTLLKTMVGLMKDFLEFWKDTIKSFMAIFKMMNELAQGSR